MIDSKLLKEALDYTLSDNSVRSRLDRRDADDRVSIHEIRIKKYKYNPEETKAILKVGIDFTTLDQSAPELEDLVITVKWNKEIGFKVSKIKTLKEIGED